MEEDYIVEVNPLEWRELCDSRLIQKIHKEKQIETYYNEGSFIIAPILKYIPEILDVAKDYSLNTVELKLLQAFKLIHQNAN